MIANQHSFGFNKVILSLDLMVFALISYLISTKIYTIHIDTYLAQLPPALLVVAISLYLLSAFEITLNVSLSSLISRNLIAVVFILFFLSFFCLSFFFFLVNVFSCLLLWESSC